MSLILCPQAGCNRKYKTEKTLQKHLSEFHKLNNNNVDYAKVPTKAEKEYSKTLQFNILKRIKENSNECAICFENPSGGAVAIPCGHAYFCYDCLNGLSEKICPFCRGKIDKVQRLFQ